MKTRDLIRRLERGGWRLDRVHGSHHVFKHPEGRRNVVVPVHGADIPEPFAKAILKQGVAALEKE
jgi:predicted RNA binding protein YcfA (HicA-like mRNA interferase family)